MIPAFLFATGIENSAPTIRGAHNGSTRLPARSSAITNSPGSTTTATTCR